MTGASGNQPTTVALNKNEGTQRGKFILCRNRNTGVEFLKVLISAFFRPPPRAEREAGTIETLSVRPSVRPSVRLSCCPSIRLFVCPPVRPLSHFEVIF